MACIPQTREEFERMDFMTKINVKKKLLQNNIIMVCHMVDPQTLPQFSPVLRKSDMKQLERSTVINSSEDVICDLLMRIMGSLNSPTWWEILESILIEGKSWELYYAMNPWDRRDMNGGGGGGGGDGRGGGGRRGEGGGGSTPSAPMKPPCGDSGRQLCVREPYNLNTPLTETAGVDRVLAPLFPEGDNRLWRVFLDCLELPEDQLEIIKTMNKSQSSDLNRLLLEQFIKRYEDEATLGALVSALWDVGPEGQQVVREMDQQRLNRPLEADGEVGGDMYDDEREGGTSATFAQAPTPRFPPDNIAAGQKFRAESKNLSFCQPPKEESLREKMVLEGKAGLSEPSQPVQSSSVVRTETSSLENLIESIVDNNRQSHIVNPSAPSSLSQQNQIFNIYIRHVKHLVLRQENTTGSDDVRMAGDDEYEHEPPVPVTGDTSVGTGHAEASEYSYIPAGGEENHEAVDVEENLSSYHPDPSDNSAHKTHPKQLDDSYNEDEERPSGPEGEQDASDIIDLRENNVIATGHAESLRDDNTLTAQSAFLMTMEGPQSGSVRGSTDALPVDMSAAPMQEETDEAGNNHPADDDATSSLPPPHDLGCKQPLSPSAPQSQHCGLMTHLSTAWTCVKDTFVGLE